MAGYTRFLYQLAPSGSNCVHCNALLTDVIIPGDAATSTPGPSTTVLGTEIVTEHDDYGHGANPSMPAAVHSRAPGREYAYEYTFDTTTQFDLHQDGGPCGAGNSCATAGYACHTVDQLSPHCYAADVMKHDPSTSLGTSHLSAGAAGATGGNANAFTRHYTATGAPKDLLDATGSRTTYGYDSKSRIRCIVHDDNDSQAFADPTHPDTSACAGPASGQVIQIDYSATSVTTTTPGALGSPVTELVTLDPVLLLAATRTTSGTTKDIDGGTHLETHSTTTSYDALGRVTLSNGPLNDAVSYDVVDTSYYDVYDPTWPYDLGQIKSITRHVGTNVANIALTKMYSEYDLFGIPHRIGDANGSQIAYTASFDRLTWTATAIGNDGVMTGASSIVLNANGTVRSQQDPAGVCVTYEYADESGYVGAPTVVRRSNTGCGVIPIDRSHGEVEVRSYVQGEADRLQSVTRFTDGVVETAYSGFRYDRDRRLTDSTTLDSTSPFTYMRLSITYQAGTADSVARCEV